jgi:predicted nucleic-acid-binding protein
LISLDTNVLIRLFVADDEAQATRAARLFAAAEEIFVTKTVVLEFAWVLSAVYGAQRAELIHALEMLAGLEKIELEDRPAVERAITQFADGYDDFADALHVCSSVQAKEFVTFDRKLVAKARKLGGPVSVRVP